jgi:hypothetical protein
LAPNFSHKVTVKHKGAQRKKTIITILIKSFWKCETSGTFFQKGFWPPEAKVVVDLGFYYSLQLWCFSDKISL